MKDQATNQKQTGRPVDCPCCGHEFDVKEAQAAFVEPFGANEGLVYAMCPTCHEAYMASDAQRRKAMNNCCFRNVKSGYLETKTSQSWAVTTCITLLLNGDDLSAAIWDGIDLPRPIYDAIVAGQLKISRVGPYFFTGYWVDEVGGDDGSH